MSYSFSNDVSLKAFTRNSQDQFENFLNSLSDPLIIWNWLAGVSNRFEFIMTINVVKIGSRFTSILRVKTT